MATEKAKLIPFPKELEDAIEADAKRCERSFVRQVVAVLKSYYDVDNVELKQNKVKFIGELEPRSDKTLPMIKLGEPDKKKKSA